MLLHVVAFSFSSPQGVPVRYCRKQTLSRSQECKRFIRRGRKGCRCLWKLKWGKEEAGLGNRELQTEMQIWQSLRQHNRNLWSGDGLLEESNTGPKWADPTTPPHSVMAEDCREEHGLSSATKTGSEGAVVGGHRRNCAPSGWTTHSFLKADASGTCVEAPPGDQHVYDG